MSQKKMSPLVSLQHRFVVTLGCGHVNVYRTPAPKTGETIACQSCGWRMRAVVSNVPEYTAKCQKEKCQFYRHAGDDDEEAERLGMQHMRDYPGHQVTVMQGTLKIRNVVNTLPVPGTPRWHKTHRTHASSLRKFLEGL